MYTPPIEEVRRHWGLAVDIHRRPERIAQFDRMLKDHVKAVAQKSLEMEVSTKEYTNDGIYILADDVSKIIQYVIDNV